jgi:hypothetical protein
MAFQTKTRAGLQSTRNFLVSLKALFKAVVNIPPTAPFHPYSKNRSTNARAEQRKNPGSPGMQKYVKISDQR